MNKNSIIPLVEKWEAYSSKNPGKDIYSFATWLLICRQEADQIKNKVPQADNLENASKVGMLITKLQKYLGLYIKPAISRLGFNKQYEYNFLHQISKMDKPTKNILSKENMVEFSTGRDVIRRLISRKLVTEEPDSADRRAMLLTLTPLGKKTLDKSYEMISETFTDFLGGLNLKEQSQLILLLTKMNDYQAQKNNYNVLFHI
jgi:DNA-binding MarR family transcriptional regulator